MKTWAAELSRRERALLSSALYAWIALVAWSRVALGEHHTLLGARLGLSIKHLVS